MKHFARSSLFITFGAFTRTSEYSIVCDHSFYHEDHSPYHDSIYEKLNATRSPTYTHLVSTKCISPSETVHVIARRSLSESELLCYTSCFFLQMEKLIKHLRKELISTRETLRTTQDQLFRRMQNGRDLSETNLPQGYEKLQAHKGEACSGWVSS